MRVTETNNANFKTDVWNRLRVSADRKVAVGPVMKSDDNAFWYFYWIANTHLGGITVEHVRGEGLTREGTKRLRSLFIRAAAELLDFDLHTFQDLDELVQWVCAAWPDGVETFRARVA